MSDELSNNYSTDFARDRSEELQTGRQDASDRETASKVRSYFETKQAFDSALHAVDDALNYRRERLESYRRLIEDETGLSAEQASSIDSLIALGRPIDRVVRSLAPQARVKLNALLALPGGAPASFQRWERDLARDPEELADAAVRSELAETIVRELGRLQKPPSCAQSDRFLYPLVALLKLREIGGTWEDVVSALRAKLQAMNAGDDADELFIAYGKNIRAFADWHCADLPRVDGKLLPGEVPVACTNLQLLAIHTLMEAAEKHREAWQNADGDGRQKIIGQIDDVVRSLAGSGLSKVPLAVAMKEYVAGTRNRETLECCIASHRPAIAQQVDKGRSTDRARVSITY